MRVCTRVRNLSNIQRLVDGVYVHVEQVRVESADIVAAHAIQWNYGTANGAMQMLNVL